MTPADVLLPKYHRYIVKHKNVRLDRKYWVCDTAMACGDSQDNVFEGDLVFKGRRLIDRAYVIFKTKTRALAFSKELYALEQEYFQL